MNIKYKASGTVAAVLPELLFEALLQFYWF